MNKNIDIGFITKLIIMIRLNPSIERLLGAKRKHLPVKGALERTNILPHGCRTSDSASSLEDDFSALY
jgi:hypothetical protein